ncbi:MULTISPECIES: VTT domain-containing protein [unclassified Empedobacter]|uniref:VTT domain-containing protein n=1 Tax=unclassified Empedobacter TaxID=2643773 RepID=UPI00244A7D57|nr:MULTISPECIES: VTT domain-containing protein [unclassified Empedobacter]MDH0658916.1 VTT domain-containing protein [Empedobacter sp. GD03865]MDH1601427.1 VTT domain-containing protein [Empedobacter sp. GD03739]
MEILDYILHIDKYLETILNDYQHWFYLILFLLIFIETGLVVMPFLPGDSLLFAAGMLAAAFPAQLNIYIVLGLLWIAAIAGDTVNYTIGKTLGTKLVTTKIFGKRIIKDSAILKTEDFFTKYGSKTIVIARFVPIVRTLAPFVAGISKMHYGTFIIYNFIGGTIWVFGITLAGYFLGTIPFIKNNFEIVVMAIIVFSLVPIIVEFVKEKIKK